MLLELIAAAEAFQLAPRDGVDVPVSTLEEVLGQVVACDAGGSRDESGFGRLLCHGLRMVEQGRVSQG